jgi:hypothetical protein
MWNTRTVGVIDDNAYGFLIWTYMSYVHAVSQTLEIELTCHYKQW